MDNEEKEVQEVKPDAAEGKRFSPRFFETRGKMGNVQLVIHWLATTIMTLLTVVILAAVIISFLRIPELFKALISGNEGSLIAILEFVASVIIALELIYVIIAQNLESVIEILMIAFTRELIIREWQMWEIMIGVAVIAGLFAVKKFLLPKKEK
ncbi:MAG: hypothetical protein IKP61_03610 [Spirochaetales bacterium]|nr:hypothetical protein [Spirochaetales bacterium]